MCQDVPVPKVVDHARRRAEIAAALWRVVARAGMEGASVRTVSAESGWSTGAVRHYFSTQDELVRFAIESMLSAVEARVQEAWTGSRTSLARCQAALEQLLPLDEARAAEVRAWLALLTRTGDAGDLGDLRQQAWAAERALCGAVVRELSGDSAAAVTGSAVASGAAVRGKANTRERARAREAARLHCFVDGLTLQAITVPDRQDAPALRAALRAYLLDLVAGKDG